MGGDVRRGLRADPGLETNMGGECLKGDAVKWVGYINGSGRRRRGHIFAVLGGHVPQLEVYFQHRKLEERKS